MPEHVNVHVPHELEQAGDGTTTRERGFEIVAALLLAVTTLAVAWSGYQAAKWSGVQARRYTQASAARSLANRAETQGSQERLQDLLNFNRWLEVSTEGNAQLTALYERRFRDEFRPAFEAWLAQDPLTNPNAVPTPLLMPEYVVTHERESERLEALADRRFEQGKEATENADDYVYSTVFFAVVLFFSGVSLRFRWERLRMIMLVAATAFLTWGIIRIAGLPIQ
jgi:hypothetical protein